MMIFARYVIFEISTLFFPKRGIALKIISVKKSFSILIFFLSKWFFKLRLDFETFVISGPSTGSDTDAVDGACKNGVFTSPSPATCSLASQCLTDSFSITNPGGSAPPTICGTNTGKHSEIMLTFVFKTDL